MKLNTRNVVIAHNDDFEFEAKSLSSSIYLRRIERLMSLAREHGFEQLIVYGDREHFSNMEYLTSYDPRFEEALLVLTENVTTVIVGNEGIDYCKCIQFPIKASLYTGFSLNSQPRKTVTLPEILRAAGLCPDSRVGVIGWKLFSPEDGFNLERTLDVPSYIKEAIEEVVSAKNVFNKTDLLMSNEYGLRHNLEVEELVLFEQCNTLVSRKVLTAFRKLRPGDNELAASQNFLLDGNPMPTYPTVSFGSKHVALGMLSPRTDSILSKGDPVLLGMGVRRANIHRTLAYVSNAEELEQFFGEGAGEFIATYFEAVCAWYESLRIGASGAEVFGASANILHPLKNYGIKLNIGHQIHTDEWTNSAFYKGSKVTLRSGMAIQCDIIATRLGHPLLGAHIEDGIFLADETMREHFANIAPAANLRVQNRREFMREVLGISLSEDVIPLSDLQAIGFPFGANADIIQVRG